MNRRHFLTIIAAGIAAPAVVRAESLMSIWVPPQKIVVLNPFEGMWQDTACTIPVTAEGQPVAVWHQQYGILRSSSLASRPTAVLDAIRGAGVACAPHTGRMTSTEKWSFL